MAIQYRRLPLTSLSATNINLTGDTIVATLHTATYAPNLDTNQWVSDLSGEVAAGGGYATGGVTLANKTLAYITANAWGGAVATSTAYALGALVTTGGNIHRCITAGTTAGTAPTYATTVGATTTDGSVSWYCEGPGTLVWTASTAYTVGWVVRPATGNGYLYRATTAGTTSGTTPTWPTTVGATVTDGGVVWECVGAALTVFAAANPSWASATFTNVRYVVFSDRTPTGAANQPLLAAIDYGSAQNGQGGAFTVQLNPEGILFYFMP